MATSFILLSTQRSGSTWVIDMLNSHPAVVAYSELLLENGCGKRFGGDLDQEFLNEYLEEQQAKGKHAPLRAQLFAYLEQVYTPAVETEAVGFKLMYGQFGAYRDLQDYFVDHGVVVVHLVRSNLLDILISKETAVERDLFHYRGGAGPKEVRVRLNTGQLTTRLAEQNREVERARRKLRADGLPYTEVIYEELAADAGNFVHVLEFLGVSARTPALVSGLKRINVAPQRDLIANYEQVVEAMSGTEFARFLR